MNKIESKSIGDYIGKRSKREDEACFEINVWAVNLESNEEMRSLASFSHSGFQEGCISFVSAKLHLSLAKEAFLSLTLQRNT